MKFYIWSNEHQAWWKAYSWGYTKLISQAGVYDEETALEIIENANIRLKEDGVPNETLVPATQRYSARSSSPLTTFIDEFMQPLPVALLRK